MKLSAFITKTDSERRGETFEQCYQMAGQLCDEVVVIDGKDSWPKEFSWELIGQHFERGYQQCTGDWVIHLDTDFIFHENDYATLRQALEASPTEMALSFWKYQMYTPDRYALKSRLVLAVNKGLYGDTIMFDSGPDLCQPSRYGTEIKPHEVPEARVAFYNYEHILKTKAQITEDVGRMDRAYQRRFGKWLYSEDGTDQSAYEGWLKMVLGRYRNHGNRLSLEEHPKIMQDIIKNLRPDQMGYSIFGNVDTCSYFQETSHA